MQSSWVGGVLAGVGSLMPWISASAAFVGTISRNGFDGGGDGIITAALGLILALVGVALLAGSGSTRTLRLAAAIFALLLGVVAVLDIGSVNQRITGLDSSVVSASVGAGLILVVFAAVLSLVGAGIPVQGATSVEATAKGPSPTAVRLIVVVGVLIAIGIVTTLVLKQQADDILRRVGESI